MNKLFRILFFDVIRSRFVFIYTALLFVLSWSVFSLNDSDVKGVLTLLNLVVITIPLISVMYATSYLYNSNEFIELLLSQPVTRKRIWLSLFAGLSLALSLACVLGMGIPIVLYTNIQTGFMILVTGILITLIFVALAMFASVITRDKAKGIGVSILLWLFFALLFDGILLFLVFQFSDYPIEKAMVFVSMLNPLMLSRNLILLQLDVSAMMGYTGAIFKDFFGNITGMLITIVVLVLWILIPFYISMRKFNSKDL